MRRVAGSILCAALLIGCSSAPPNFVKLDMSGKKNLSANNETLQRDIADCKVLEAHVREEGSLIFNTSHGKGGLRQLHALQRLRQKLSLNRRLILKCRLDTEDHELLALHGKAANDKARELGWIV
jgi:hypothetical protein